MTPWSSSRARAAASAGDRPGLRGRSAELIVSDIDDATLKETVAQIVSAAASRIPTLWTCPTRAPSSNSPTPSRRTTAFPTSWSTTTGIGVAGSFLDTPAEQFDRVLTSTCRSGQRLPPVQPPNGRPGNGGHIVNV